MMTKEIIEESSIFSLAYYADNVLQKIEVGVEQVMTKGYLDNSKILWLAVNNHVPGTAVKLLVNQTLCFITRKI